MTVGELKAFLNNYPDDMQVITSWCSDYDVVEPAQFTVVSAVDKGTYVMRSHPTMSPENKQAEKQYLHLMGN